MLYLAYGGKVRPEHLAWNMKYPQDEFDKSSVYNRRYRRRCSLALPHLFEEIESSLSAGSNRFGSSFVRGPLNVFISPIIH